MKLGSNVLHPELGLRIQEVARQCRRTQWIRSATRFGIATLALVCLFTFVLTWAPEEGSSRGYLVGLFTPPHDTDYNNN